MSRQISLNAQTSRLLDAVRVEDCIEGSPSAGFDRPKPELSKRATVPHHHAYSLCCEPMLCRSCRRCGASGSPGASTLELNGVLPMCRGGDRHGLPPNGIGCRISLLFGRISFDASYDRSLRSRSGVGLLNDMGQLVSDQHPSWLSLWTILLSAEHNVRSYRVGKRVHGGRSLGRRGIGMDPNMAEVVAKAGLHEGQRHSVQWLAGGTERLVHDVRCSASPRALRAWSGSFVVAGPGNTRVAAAPLERRQPQAFLGPSVHQEWDSHPAAPLARWHAVRTTRPDAQAPE